MMTADVKGSTVDMVTLRNGLEVTAKWDKGTLMAKTYANRTQADRAAAQLGPGWVVYGTRPFYVGRDTP